jgi:hypothetical protein
MSSQIEDEAMTTKAIGGVDSMIANCAGAKTATTMTTLTPICMMINLQATPTRNVAVAVGGAVVSGNYSPTTTEPLDDFATAVRPRAGTPSKMQTVSIDRRILAGDSASDLHSSVVETKAKNSSLEAGTQADANYFPTSPLPATSKRNSSPAKLATTDDRTLLMLQMRQQTWDAESQFPETAVWNSFRTPTLVVERARRTKALQFEAHLRAFRSKAGVLPSASCSRTSITRKATQERSYSTKRWRAAVAVGGEQRTCSAKNVDTRLEAGRYSIVHRSSAA